MSVEKSAPWLSRIPVSGQWAALIVIAGTASTGLEAVGVPAALLLGPMLVSVAFAVSGTTIRVPRPAFLLAQGVAGCLIASNLTPQTLFNLAGHLPLLLAAVFATLVFSALVGWGAGRFGGIQPEAAVWGFLPGMASAVVALADDFGIDARLVAFIQYVRVAIVILIMSSVARFGFHTVPADPSSLEHGFAWLPFIITLAIVALALLASRMSWLPSGSMLVPMLVGACVQGSGAMPLTLPFWLLGVAYAVIGFQVGLRFTPQIVLNAIRRVPTVIAGSIVLNALAGLSAFVLAEVTGIDGLTAFLATTPGSIDSVAIVAIGSHADISFVLALQTLRLFAVVFLGPIAARGIVRYALPRSPAPSLERS